MAHGKRYKDLLEANDLDKTYPPKEALELVQELAKGTAFDEGIELHLRLGIDPAKGDQQVKGTVTLPHGTGKTKRIAAIVEGDAAKEATEAGADLVGGADLIEEIKKTGKAGFDIAVTTPDMMKHLAKVAKILGPKGLMPTPKNETITPNVGKTIEELKAGKIAFKNDNTANLHQLIGRASFGTDKLLENYQVLMDAVNKAKPSTSKGTYVKAAYLSSSMGPSVKVSA